MWCFEVIRILDSAMMLLLLQILKVSSLYLRHLGQLCILYCIYLESKKNVTNIRQLFLLFMKNNLGNWSNFTFSIKLSQKNPGFFLFNNLKRKAKIGFSFRPSANFCLFLLKSKPLNSCFFNPVEAMTNKKVSFWGKKKRKLNNFEIERTSLSEK